MPTDGGVGADGPHVVVIILIRVLPRHPSLLFHVDHGMERFAK